MWLFEQCQAFLAGKMFLDLRKDIHANQFEAIEVSSSSPLHPPECNGNFGLLHFFQPILTSRLQSAVLWLVEIKYWNFIGLKKCTSRLKFSSHYRTTVLREAGSTLNDFDFTLPRKGCKKPHHDYFMCKSIGERSLMTSNSRVGRGGPKWPTKIGRYRLKIVGHGR